MPTLVWDLGEWFGVFYFLIIWVVRSKFRYIKCSWFIFSLFCVLPIFNIELMKFKMCSFRYFMNLNHLTRLPCLSWISDFIILEYSRFKSFIYIFFLFYLWTSHPLNHRFTFHYKHCILFNLMKKIIIRSII